MANDEVAAIIPGDGSEEHSDYHDIILRLKGRDLQRISHLHPSYSSSTMLCSFHMVKMAGIKPFLLKLWLREGVDRIRSLSTAIMHTDSIQDLESSHCCFEEETSFKSLLSMHGLLWSRAL